MYAFYSLLVYIFYTVFKKEEEDALEGACGASSDVCLAISCPAASGDLLLGKHCFAGEHACVTSHSTT